MFESLMEDQQVSLSRFFSYAFFFRDTIDRQTHNFLDHTIHSVLPRL